MNQKRIRKNVLTKGILAGMLVFSMGAGSVFASTNAGADDAADEKALKSTIAPSENETGTPSLLPGDFFYFIKSVYENIRLFITNDELQEAKLHSEFARERLSEANALLLEGETEKSGKLLQKSLENQQTAVELAAAEPVEPDKESKLDEVKSVKTDLQHNILALTAALEKKKNPQAQQSLLKNIIKAFGHLENKLAKLEENSEQQAPLSSDETAEQTAAVSSEGAVASKKESERKASPEKQDKIVKDENQDFNEKFDKRQKNENNKKNGYNNQNDPKQTSSNGQ